MSNYIGIVMGGYVDEDMRLMNREELNKRIVNLQKAIKILRESNHFYALVGCPFPKQVNDNELCNIDLDGEYYRGGKKAREAESEVKEILGE